MGEIREVKGREEKEKISKRREERYTRMKTRSVRMTNTDRYSFQYPPSIVAVTYTHTHTMRDEGF